MNIDKNKINKVGKVMEEFLRGFYGSIQFNFFNGKYVNTNINQTVQPEKQETNRE